MRTKYTIQYIRGCYDTAGEGPVGTKLVEINKGDENRYNIRARLVAQEVAKWKVAAIFAVMPSWEVKKMLLSMATTEGIGYGPGWHYKIDYIVMKRAYFYAPA